MTRIEIKKIEKMIELIELDLITIKSSNLDIVLELLYTMKDKFDKKNEDIEVKIPKNVTHRHIELATYLYSKILCNNSKAKEPNLNRWAAEIEVMERIDNRNIDDIKRIIDWCQADSFWHKNILSPKKLRKHFDRLELNNNTSTLHNSRNILIDFMNN